MFAFAPSTYTITSRGIGLTLRCPQQFGYVYLIHFDTPYKHAAHYLGSCIDLDTRLHLHRTGTGARLMEVVTSAGISWHVSKIWQCNSPEEARLLEAKYKRWCNDKRLCPECQHRTPDPLAMMYAGHYPFHLFDKPGKRQPMTTTRPVYYLH